MCGVNGCRNPQCQYVRTKHKLQMALCRARKKNAKSERTQDLKLQITALKERHITEGKKRMRDPNASVVSSGTKRRGTRYAEGVKLSAEQYHSQSVKDTKIHRRKFDLHGNVTQEEIEDSKSHRVSDKMTRSVEFKRCVEAYKERILQDELHMIGDQVVREFLRAKQHGQMQTLKTLPLGGMYAHQHMPIVDALWTYAEKLQLVFAKVDGVAGAIKRTLGCGKVQESAAYFEEKRRRFTALGYPTIGSAYGAASNLMAKVATEVDESLALVSRLDARWQDKTQPAIAQHEIGGAMPLFQTEYDHKLDQNITRQVGVRRVYQTVQLHPLKRALIPEMLKHVSGLRKYVPQGKAACLGCFTPERITSLALRGCREVCRDTELLRIISEEWEQGDFTSILSVYLSIQTEIRLLLGLDMRAYAHLEITRMRDFGDVVAFSPLHAYAPKKHGYSQFHDNIKTKYVECRVDFPKHEFSAEFGLDLRLPIQLMLVLLKQHVDNPETYHAVVREFKSNTGARVDQKLRHVFDKAQFDDPIDHFFVYEGAEVPLVLLDEPEFAHYRVAQQEVEASRRNSV